ncbi:hypothetical protein PG985_007011 [Apiospora marii]|uniref:Uncharacterized protein n=1 Tax=Apiospora marii TaxID=335849 RepID=A0ABR1SH32_9PEZI
MNQSRFGGGLPPINQDPSEKQADKQRAETKKHRRARRKEAHDRKYEIFGTHGELQSSLEAPDDNDDDTTSQQDSQQDDDEYLDWDDLGG